jgi:hypothetical protein
LWKHIDAFFDSNLWINLQWELNNQIRIKSRHFFLYNLRSLLNVDFVYKRWVRKKFFVCKKIFKKCNLRFSIAFEEVEMMKNRSQFIFYVKMSQAAIQKQNCDRISWCDYNHVMWLPSRDVIKMIVCRAK